MSSQGESLCIAYIPRYKILLYRIGAHVLGRDGRMLFGSSRARYATFDNVMAGTIIMVLCRSSRVRIISYGPSSSHRRRLHRHCRRCSKAGRDHRRQRARAVAAVSFCRSNRFFRYTSGAHCNITTSLSRSCYVSRTLRRRGGRDHVGHLCRSVARY